VFVTNKPYKNLAHKKWGLSQIPISWLFIFQLNLAGRIIGATDQVAILIYLPDVLGIVIIQIRGGSRSSKRGGIGSYAISISGTRHVFHSEDDKAVRSS